MSEVFLHQIVYSPQTLAGLEAGYTALDNLDGSRNDWREYWPIRRFLLSQTLDEAAYYGFFSPRFREKIGLSHAQVVQFVQAAPENTDVFTFNPQPDMGAFFLNVFEQNEVFDPGFIAASEAFLAAIGRPLKLAPLVMDSRNIVFSNYFIARPAFWRAWLEINEQLFAICESTDDEQQGLRELLLHSTSYPGAVQRKVFLSERIVSLLLAVSPALRIRSYDTFACAWSTSKLAEFKLEAIMSDALKIAMREQGFPEYSTAFAALRDKLRGA